MLLWLIHLIDEWLTSHDLYWMVMVFDQLAFRVFAAGICAFFIVVIFGKRVVRWLTVRKIGDQAFFDAAPLNEALRAKSNTPTMGGILIVMALLGVTLVFADLDSSYVKFAIIIVVWMAVLGGMDDWLKLTASSRPGGSRQGLYAWEKLIFQLGIGVLIGYFAYRAAFPAPADTPILAHVVNLPFQKTYENQQGAVAQGLFYLPMWAYVLVMTVMMAGMSNAVNITDGMDGLAAGISAAVALGLMVLCLIAGDEGVAARLLVPYVAASDQLAVVAAGLAGASLGFLWFNCAPAAVFMGDTGSLLLGGLIGYIAVVIRQEIVLLIMSGIFLVEIASVVLQVGVFKYTRRRHGEGRRIFCCAPYHWHLYMSNWPEQKVVARFWILSVILVAIALASLKLR